MGFPGADEAIENNWMKENEIKAVAGCQVLELLLGTCVLTFIIHNFWTIMIK